MKVDPAMKKQAWKLYLEGCTRKKIHRLTGIPLATLTRFIEKGNPACGHRPWRDRRADIYRRREEIEDGIISKSIMGRTRLLSDIEQRGLRKLQQRVHQADQPLSVSELAAVSRASNDALRLAVDAARVGPQTQINVQATAQMATFGQGRAVDPAERDGVGGARLTIATIQALQQATPEEQRALRAWQRKYTLALEEQGLPALPSEQDELNDVVDAQIADDTEKHHGD